MKCLPLTAKTYRLLQAMCRLPQNSYRLPQIYCNALRKMVSCNQKE